MATFVLLPGAGSTPWSWHLVEAELRARGHDSIAVDLPNDDDTADLCTYADVAIKAIGDRSGASDGLVVVAHSLGGFTGPLVCDRVEVDLLILLAAMIPRPHESAGEWWANTGHGQARLEQAERDGLPIEGEGAIFFDFLHDVPSELVAESVHHIRPQSGTPFEKPWPLDAWPAVPTRVLICRHDRFFPPGFMRRVTRERLQIEPDELDAGHLPMLGHPMLLAARLMAYWDELGQKQNL